MQKKILVDMILIDAICVVFSIFLILSTLVEKDANLWKEHLAITLFMICSPVYVSIRFIEMKKDKKK